MYAGQEVDFACAWFAGFGRNAGCAHDAAYAAIDALNKLHKLAPLPFPPPRDLPEPRLSLLDVLGDTSVREAVRAVKAIEKAGPINVHSGGDCGSTKSPKTRALVVDTMLGDFHEAAQAEVPQFHDLLGDIAYGFGETQYYYDRFYDPFRDDPAPILAVPGDSCSARFEVLPEAGALSRTAQIQPGVFLPFEAPFVRIVGMDRNALEDPGDIASDEIGNSKLVFLPRRSNASRPRNVRAPFCSRRIIRPMPVAERTAAARICNGKSARSAIRPASGRMRSSPGTPIAIGASRARRTARKSRTSFAGIRDTTFSCCDGPGPRPGPKAAREVRKARDT